MTNPSPKTFRAFAGPGIDHPSATLRVDDDEAAAILGDLDGVEWSAPVYVGSGRHAGYVIHHAHQKSVTALFAADGIVGFYAGSYLWIAPEHRGRGLSTPLILAAAARRGGTVLPPGIVVQGYSPAGLAAHRAAFEAISALNSRQTVAEAGAPWRSSEAIHSSR